MLWFNCVSRLSQLRLLRGDHVSQPGNGITQLLALLHCWAIAQQRFAVASSSLPMRCLRAPGIAQTIASLFIQRPLSIAVLRRYEGRWQQ